MKRISIFAISLLIAGCQSGSSSAKAPTRGEVQGCYLGDEPLPCSKVRTKEGSIVTFYPLFLGSKVKRAAEGPVWRSGYGFVELPPWHGASQDAALYVRLVVNASTNSAGCPKATADPNVPTTTHLIQPKFLNIASLSSVWPQPNGPESTVATP